MEDHTNFLKESDLFHNLNDTQIAMINSICELKHFNKNEIIFIENITETELYLILQGQVEIVVNPDLVSPQPQETSKSHTIATLGRGQSFGEMALVDQGIRSAGAVASEKKTMLLMISRKKLLLLCDTFPELGYRVMFNLAVDLAQKIRKTDLLIRESLLEK
ncbi:MAG: cyclic nucleotide-binding domain-containing protein [Anaerolineaceae bacterium]|nr:cyclic nucleotide-binding domain-containing protein [Anaerolineaceae bacterium]